MSPKGVYVHETQCCWFGAARGAKVVQDDGNGMCDRHRAQLQEFAYWLRHRHELPE